jgi:hypothetical protein
MNTELLKNIIMQFMPFAQKQIGFKNPPRLFLRNDSENAKNPFGKTAFYDPAQKSVTLYITGRHPKDVLRSLGHELVHHKQNCDGQFDNESSMGQGYAQEDPHLRQMELEANRDGSMCLRDFEDMLKKENTIYYEHLQKGDKKMSTKDWKNKEITQLLSEAWGFKFNTLEEFNEFNENGELQVEGEEEIEELAQASKSERPRKPKLQRDRRDDGDDSTEKNAPAPPRVTGKMEEGEHEEDLDETIEESEEELNEGEEAELEEGAFSPNHYCVHHGGVSRNGAVEMAEAIAHNFNEDLGHVTHYDMKFEDGTIMEGVPFDEIQVTNATLAEGHGGHKLGKRDDDEDEAVEENETVDKLKEAIAKIITKHLKG